MLRLDPSGPAERALVFLPGFMTSASSYRTLLEPLTAHGISVIVPQLYRRGLGALTGRATVEQEATDAAALCRDIRRGGDAPVVLGGHSRGGQAAFRAAKLLSAESALAGLVLVDPVDGSGRAPSTPTSTMGLAELSCPCLVVGAGLSGRCAPAAVNHDHFAAAVPSARHVVVTRLGHGDILDEGPRSRAARLCGGAEDPDPGRAAVTALLAWFCTGADRALPEDRGLLDWRRRA